MMNEAAITAIKKAIAKYDLTISPINNATRKIYVFLRLYYEWFIIKMAKITIEKYFYCKVIVLMKKYILSLICLGVIVGSIGAWAGLSYISSRDKEEQIIAEDQADDILPDITEPPYVPEEPIPEPMRIKPSTRIIYEYYYQSDNRTEVRDENPPYFLLDQTREKIEEYYSDWDIVELNENRVKLRRTIPGSPEAHYVLGVKDNYVAVYHRSKTGTVSLKEITATPIGALSLEEQNKLISGINVQNEDQLAKMLEDYGS